MDRHDVAMQTHVFRRSIGPHQIMGFAVRHRVGVKEITRLGVCATRKHLHARNERRDGDAAGYPDLVRLGAFEIELVLRPFNHQIGTTWQLAVQAQGGVAQFFHDENDAMGLRASAGV
jgi:hypothetical protein